MTMILSHAAVVEPRQACVHEPPCPAWNDSNHDAAVVIDRHPELGAERLCNGVWVWDDMGELLPNGNTVPAHNSEPPHRLWDSDVPPVTADLHAVLPGESKPVCGQTGDTSTNAIQVSCWRCRGVLQNGGGS